MRPFLYFPASKSKNKILEDEVFSCLPTVVSSITNHHIVQLQTRLFTFGLHQNTFLAAKLLNLCSTTSFMCHARLLFHHIADPSPCMWNTFLRCLSQNNFPLDTLKAYTQMKNRGIPPNNFTFPFLFKACALLPHAPSVGKALHSEVIRVGLKLDVYVNNSLVDMYAKHGCLESAGRVFEEMDVKDIVAWNSMIAGYFRKESVEKGKDFFDRMPVRDIVSWNTAIAGYTQNRRGVEALKLFRRMQHEGICPDVVTFVGVLSACAQVGAIEIGKWVHKYIERRNISLDTMLYNCLIDMYAKCGSLKDARMVFNKMEKRCVVSWNSMIGGFAIHGYGEDAVAIFEEMKREVVPNDITFIAVLSACAHSGLLQEGRSYFSTMQENHAITPQVEHYGCMVDLFGRCGCVLEAHELIKTMPLPPDAGIWSALLGACRKHDHLGFAEIALVQLLELEPWNAGNYALLSNIYASEGRWGDVERVRSMMKGRSIKKTPGSSSTEVDGVIHEFVIGDRSHPRSEDIYSKLEELAVALRLAGYVPETGNVLHDVAEEEKEQALGVHSEKLAVAFGLISVHSAAPLRVVKNLRICGDCHIVIKMLSKIAGREILVRDRIRFHHFSDGSCSCKDFW